MSIFAKTISRLTAIVAVITVSLSIGLTPVTVHAGLFDGAKDQACSGAALEDGKTCDTINADKSVSSVLKTALDLLSLVVGVAAIIMVILAGLRFVLSGGDSTSVASARNSLIYALVGLVIVVMAQAIVYFVINRVTAPPGSAPAPTPTRRPPAPSGPQSELRPL